MTSPFLDSRLLWDFLWQSTLWLSIGLMCSVIWRSRPARAHWVLCLVMLAAVMTPILSVAARQSEWGLFATPRLGSGREQFGWEAYDSCPAFRRPPAPNARQRQHADDEEFLGANAWPLPKQEATEGTVEAGLEPAIPVEMLTIGLWFSWAILSAAMLVRLCWMIVRAIGVVSRATETGNADLRDGMAVAAERLRLRMDPQMRISAEAPAPMIWCWSRPPLLIMPASPPLSSVDWCAIICHELAHWLRRDHWSTLASEICICLMPWHPLMWAARRQLGQLSEMACDDWAIGCGASKTDYADSLLNLVPSQPQSFALCAVSRRSLPNRIKRILSAASADARLGTFWPCAASGLVLVASGFTALAQTRPDRAAESAQRGNDNTEASQKPDGVDANLSGNGRSDRLIVRGRVVGPDGRSIVGAKVYAAKLQEIYRVPLAASTSGNSGRFELAIGKAELKGEIVDIAAAAPGFGPAWIRGPDAEDAEELILRLVPDEPVRGRIIDLQGRPVAGVRVSVNSLQLALTVPVDTNWTLRGVRVSVNSLQLAESDDLTPLITSLQEQQQGVRRHVAAHVQITRIGGAITPTLYPAIETDDDGRFVLRNVGRERQASLIIEAPAIETQSIEVFSRQGLAPIQVPAKDHFPELSKTAYYGSEFTHVVEPSRPVVGTVRDASTGQPLAGVRVASTVPVGRPSRFVETTTDAKGRYRLTGLRRANDQRVMVIAPPGQFYPVMTAGVGLSPGLEPAQTDIDVPRGIRIVGTVRNKSTGQPVAAQVSYFLFLTDPHFRRAADNDLYLAREFTSIETDADGKFSLVGLPGRGIVAARATTSAYIDAVGAEQIDGFVETLDRNRHFITSPSVCVADEYHALAEVSAENHDEPVHRDLLLDPGKSVRGKVVGPTGEELTGAMVFGLTAQKWEREPLSTSSFTVSGLKAGDKRTVLFLHDDAQLAGMMEVDPTGGESVIAKLQPWGTLKGRLLKADGQPRVGVALEFYRSAAYQLVPTLPSERRLTDSEGRFRITGLIPGVPCNFAVLDRNTDGIVLNSVAQNVVASPGQITDLGDVRTGLR
ncbi:MAG TPA: M56 family metallopeptidase [Pirellulaceae bacterium]|nr:M56 family metallopeptidase [Pirellulaceae bacterium]